MKKQVAVIGGGAAGLTAAIWAARSGASAVILEHTDRVGKKILSTGNGRCNLTNSKMEASCYRSGDPQFPMEAISQFGWKDTLRWFSSMGLLCRCRMESYYYPMSDQASAVLDCLRMECSRLGITIRTGIQPERIRRMREGRRSFYEIMTDQGEVRADAVILACGSKAAPNTGSDGSGYELAKSLGHRIIKPLPALVQLRCQGNHYRQLAGIRTEADLRLLVNDREMWRERGELQITDYGISGIPVFQLSRFAARGMDEGKKVRVMIDFLPFMDKKESRIFLEQRFAEFGDRNGEDFLTGVLHKKLAAVLLKMAGIRLDQPVSSASIRQRDHLLRAIKEYEALVSSVNPFANAQVCCGGVDVREVDPSTMESRLMGDIYFAGEILDVDGICGGYNLQWAWSSGKAAGCRAAQKRRQE
ncbi:MAG TPA: NAD(P)/FAD-dependent oxidoreductase [Candidatus Caccovicinus merdipullorum]|uniref:NAD(P)/FAD-dependent oxidoreductase n=1 Tax=Candidatus Caccovicinus merdipullorum TaxID=2840724 RepID=A0A9D1GIF9_9FIRM|nr:NAD(P)/FAD-dependent oxidoreductase [Candidatus Caccovicinus merdipullorum]